jgi:hypothetical protein
LNLPHGGDHSNQTIINLVVPNAISLVASVAEKNAVALTKNENPQPVANESIVRSKIIIY